CQRLRLAMFPAAPDRSDGVNHEPSGQTIAPRNFRFAWPTTVQAPAFHSQFRACSAVNRAIDSATAKQRRIGCVYNRINVKLRDIAAIDLDLVIGLFLHERSRVYAKTKAMRRRLALQKHFVRKSTDALVRFRASFGSAHASSRRFSSPRPS